MNSPRSRCIYRGAKNASTPNTEPIRILQILEPIRNDIKRAWENYGRSNKSEMTQSVLGKINGRSRWENV